MNAIQLIRQWCSDNGHSFCYGNPYQVEEWMGNTDFSQSAHETAVYAYLLTSSRYVDQHDTYDVGVFFARLIPFDFDNQSIDTVTEDLKELSKGLLAYIHAGNLFGWSDARWQYGYDDYAENVAWCCLRVTLTALSAECTPLNPEPPEPPVELDVLNFYMPFGGTITLRRVGSPTVVELEYSTDGGQTWHIWEEVDTDRTITLPQDGRVWIRNTSEISTRFSLGVGSYYKFISNKHYYANGNIASLKCKNPSLAVADNYDFVFLFNESPLLSSPRMTFKVLKQRQYQSCFRATTTIRVITDMTDISAVGSTDYWFSQLVLQGGVYGDFYCPSELTIPTGQNGIPTGWTRHDLEELNN